MFISAWRILALWPMTCVRAISYRRSTSFLWKERSLVKQMPTAGKTIQSESSTDVDEKSSRLWSSSCRQSVWAAMNTAHLVSVLLTCYCLLFCWSDRPPQQMLSSIFCHLSVSPSMSWAPQTWMSKLRLELIQLDSETERGPESSGRNNTQGS